MKKACVIGHPVAHSRSPLIHGWWLKQYQLEGSYERQDVPPAELANWLRALAENGYVGANVTLPHKERALEYVMADDTATAIGAVNTLWVEEGRLRGTNTDAEGFIENLRSACPHWQDTTRHATILGAGGAARAIAYALSQANIQMTLINRTPERAQALTALAPDCMSSSGWDGMEKILAGTDLLINTTSLGMTGQPDLEIDLSPLPDHGCVCDIVYNPLETSLLKAAAARGLQTVDGLGMLLHQAVPGFERWFGLRPTVTPELRAYMIGQGAGGKG